ncbi:MAG: hypothetical protein IPN72_21330 [Saprospiraceae bacterium]|nr:hypothetical protein [Saprospiraceae bacterium]
MDNTKPMSFYMRIIHRYLGFFLAGVMAVYSLSGIILIFRDTDFLKNVTHHEETIAAGLDAQKLGETLKIRGLKIDKQEGDIAYFRDGTYNVATGAASFDTKEMPVMIEKLTHLHKAKSQDPLFYLNIFFGLGLFFFVISSFWMFMPSSSVFKKGIYFTLGGIVLTLILLFVK